MSDMSFEDLVRAWGMLVDQYLASDEWRTDAKLPDWQSVDTVVFRALLRAFVRPPANIAAPVRAKLNDWSQDEAGAVRRMSDAIGKRPFAEFHDLASGVAAALGRRFAQLIAEGHDYASRADVSALAGLARPTLPVDGPDPELLKQCRDTEPPTVIPPAYPAAHVPEEEMVPSIRLPVFTQPRIVILNEEDGHGGKPDKT